MKTYQFFIAAFLSAVTVDGLYAQVEIPDNQTIKMGNKNVAVYISTTGKYGSANGFDFNLNSSLEGIVIESGISESGGFYVDGDYAVIWSPGDQGRLLRIYDEDLMSGTSYERAYFDGGGNLFTISDENQKRDIVQITDATDKLRAIKGVEYFYIKPENDEKSTPDKAITTVSERKYMGFLAQDVEQVMPDAVDTDEHGNKFINYSSIIPVLVEACKSQQEMLETQDEAIRSLLTELNLLKEEVASLTRK